MNRASHHSLVCVIAAFVGCGIVSGDEKDDWKALKGTWKVDKAVLAGADSTDTFKSAVLTIEEKKYTLPFAGQDDKGTLAIDTTKKPKRITVTGTEGPNKGKTYEAIYELDGDSLKIAYSLEGKDPPTAFESKEGTKTLFVVYKREKK